MYKRYRTYRLLILSLRRGATNGSACEGSASDAWHGKQTEAEASGCCDGDGGDAGGASAT